MPEILSRTAQATAALTRLKPVWNNRSISLSSKIQLIHSLVTSIFLYAYESSTLTAELQRRIQAVEMCCCSEIQRISYKHHVTHEEVCAKQTTWKSSDHCKETQTTVVRSCLLFIRLAKTILQKSTVKGGRRKNRRKKRWEDNTKEWTDLAFTKSQRAVENRQKWRKLVVKSSVVPQWALRSRDGWRRWSAYSMHRSV